MFRLIQRQQHGGGGDFDWKVSIYAMFQHMLEFEDPMLFRDPFVCVGVVSLVRSFLIILVNMSCSFHSTYDYIPLMITFHF